MPTTPSMSFEPALIRLDPVMSQRYVTMVNVALNGPATYTKGQILAEYSASASTGTFGIYASTGSGGLNIPKGILQYSCTVDSSGNIAIYGEFSQTQRGVPMYMPGMAVWRVADLIGLDGNALTVLGGSYVEGSSAGGLVQI